MGRKQYDHGQIIFIMPTTRISLNFATSSDSSVITGNNCAIFDNSTVTEIQHGDLVLQVTREASDLIAAD